MQMKIVFSGFEHVVRMRMYSFEKCSDQFYGHSNNMRRCVVWIIISQEERPLILSSIWELCFAAWLSIFVCNKNCTTDVSGKLLIAS